MQRPPLALVLVLLIAPRLGAQEKVDYLRDVKPLLKERCFSCHGALKQKASLRLDTVALMRQGGDAGPALSPGKAHESLLLQRVTAKDLSKRMPPPSEGEPLTEKQVALLKAWIDQGAKGPANEKAEADPREHWAFRKPVRPPVPRVKNPAWQANPIDAFLAAEQEKHGLTPQPPAPRHVLLRRVYLDLIGLPPTREELHAFLQDSAPDAYEKVVDRLLASPQYGERWARHCMDVWRYSDWYGRRAVPDVWNSAPQIWRWRDWIVESLNADKGYDRMVQEMLAADEICPEDDKAQVATGYIVRNWYALNPNQWMRDLVEHTGKAFLGLTFNCAHCHDHKYDPIAHEDYFRLRAFFEPLQLRQDRWPGEGDPGPFQKYEYTKLRKVVKLGSIRVFDERPDAKTFVYLQGDERLRAEGKPPVAPGVPAFLGKVSVETVQLPPEAYYPGLKSFVQQEELEAAARDVDAAILLVARALVALEHADSEEVRSHARKALALAGAKMAAAEAHAAAVKARVAADNARHKKGPGDLSALARAASKAERHATVLRAREKLLQAQHDAAEAQAQAARLEGKEREQAIVAAKKAESQLAGLKNTLAAAEKAAEQTSETYTPFSPFYPATSTGRRKALALWLTSPDNPLAARVAVNHIWLRHFDKPLVETVFDFGRNGKKPSHPELLDWLACELMDPSPQPSPQRGEGAGKVLPSPPRGEGAAKVLPSPPRGEGSGVRGTGAWSMKHLHRLIVTSQAYRQHSAYGKDDPNLTHDPDNRFLWRFPAHRLESEAIRDSLLAVAGELDRTVGGPVLENIDELKSKRRSLYFSVYPEDGGALKFVEIFDAPDPCDCYRRPESILPQQALAMTNNLLALNNSRLLARRLSEKLAPNASAETFVNAAFEQVLSRLPTPDERQRCLDFLAKQTALYRQTKIAPSSAKDVVPPALDPIMRARESLVRALLNHTEFVTIR